MEGRTELVGHSTATAKTTADYVSSEMLFAATTERGSPEKTSIPNLNRNSPY